ncbi:MAG TPA: hypothetical protein VL358_01380 [Caulobacteraceae bacterium]|jgi:hypothetical protein|nr:hypothetical protein [Caulobacteraceae bacterium]
MFHDWDSFYLLIGSAAAALIGLLFVVATLTSSLETESAATGASVFMTPTVFHFAVVLVLSAMALTPGMTPTLACAAVGAAALIGLIYSAVVSWTIHRGKVPTTPHWSDLWCYGVTPAAIYLALGAAAAGLCARTADAPLALGALLTALLLVGVRNAWDLVTYLAPRRKTDG